MSNKYKTYDNIVISKLTCLSEINECMLTRGCSRPAIKYYFCSFNFHENFLDFLIIFKYSVHVVGTAIIYSVHLWNSALLENFIDFYTYVLNMQNLLEYFLWLMDLKWLELIDIVLSPYIVQYTCSFFQILYYIFKNKNKIDSNYIILSFIKVRRTINLVNYVCA